MKLRNRAPRGAGDARDADRGAGRRRVRIELEQLEQEPRARTPARRPPRAARARAPAGRVHDLPQAARRDAAEPRQVAASAPAPARPRVRRPARLPTAAPRSPSARAGRRRSWRSGGGFAGGNSKFAKAFKACGSKLGSAASNYARGRFPGGGRLPGGGGFGGPRRGQFHFSTAALKSFVTCIRKNGFATMPEPNASGKFPRSVEKNAKFQTANAKCESILRTGIHARGQSTTSTSSSTASA